MAAICPAVLARNEAEYHEQMRRVASFARRVQIDLSDGRFAPGVTVGPNKAWWPVGVAADFHLMYIDPLPAIESILSHRPNLIIVHAEADGDFKDVLSLCHDAKVKVGVALLPQTHPEALLPALQSIDHVLIFGGTLGSYGGHADLRLLDKASYLKMRRPDIEIGWDGGANLQNVSILVSGGVDVITVGGFVQNASDPERAYAALKRIADETGTT